MNLLAEFAQYWTADLWSAGLQVAIFVLLVYAASGCLRSFPARYRYILWLLILIRLAVPGPVRSPLGIGQYSERFFTAVAQRISVKLLPSTPQRPASETMLKTGLDKADVPLMNSASVLTKTREVDVGGLVPSFLWLSGVLFLCTVVIVRVVLIHKMMRRLCPISRSDLIAAVDRLRKRLKLTCSIALLEASDLDSIRYPSVHGMFRPKMVIPAEMVLNWTVEALEPLVIHELIHIKRRDYLVNTVQILFQVLYFYHPMVWFANHMIRRERELACDDDVVRYLSGHPTPYVRSMLEVAELAAHCNGRQIPGIAMAKDLSSLGSRIRRMMMKRYAVVEQPGRLYLGVVLFLGLLCAAVSAQRGETAPSKLNATALNDIAGHQRPGIDSKSPQFAQSGLSPVMHPSKLSRLRQESSAVLLKLVQAKSAKVEDPLAARAIDVEPAYSYDEYTIYTNATQEPDPERRAALLIQFIEQFPDSQLMPYVTYAYLNLLRAFDQQKKYDALETLAEQWLQIVPSDLYARAFLGGAAAKLGHNEKAITNLEVIYRSKPSGYLAYEIGQTYEKMGKSEQAVLFYARAVLQGTNESDARTHLESLYKALHGNSTIGIEGLYDKAKRELEPQD